MKKTLLIISSLALSLSTADVQGTGLPASPNKVSSGTGTEGATQGASVGPVPGELNIEKFNIENGLAGLGNDLLLIISSEMRSLKDLQNFLGINKTTFNLRKHYESFVWSSKPMSVSISKVKENLKTLKIVVDANAFRENMPVYLNGLRTSGKSLLLHALDKGLYEDAAALMHCGAGLAQGESFSQGALYTFSERGDFYSVETLVEHGADVNQDPNGREPIYIASSRGHLSIVECLVNHGVDVNKTTTKFGFTPLGIASFRGHLSIVEYLISHGADVNKAAQDGFTPLHEASGQGHLSIVEYLINHGADVNKASTKFGKTPLYMASFRGHLSIVEYLVNHGADVNVNNICGTPLITAAERGHLSVVEYLVEHGTDVNEISRYATPLGIASEEGYLSIVECLVNHGADVNKAPEYGKTSLAVARTPAVRDFLISHGAHV